MRRTIAIGDIHGCGTALKTLLPQLKLTLQDTVVLVGDIIDRGPETKLVIELLLELRQNCRELVFIRGNHEEMLIDALSRGPLTNMWLTYGGQDVLDSYDVDSVRKIPAKHLNFIESSIDYWENKTEIFVHASLHPLRSLQAQFTQHLRWERFQGDEEPHPSGKRVVCGHTPLASGKPKVIKGWVDIDTYAYKGLPLTAFDTTNDLFYQADQAGKVHPSFSVESLLLNEPADTKTNLA